MAGPSWKRRSCRRLTGGAAARPFVTHHNALDRDLFLRTATELYLKRAIVGGFEDVYEFGKFFRNEGMSPQHNPEFTMLEMFVGGADYNGVMDFVEVLVSTVVEKVLGTTKVMRDGEEIDFAAPWPRVVLRDKLQELAGIDIYAMNRDELAEVAGEDAEENDDWAGLVDTLQGKMVEPKLIQPTFVTVLPIDIWPLVKVHPDDPKVCEAFDGIVAGMEIVGGGTDINDPVEQRERFIGQRERQESGAEDDPHPHDEEFVHALEYGMPPASGCGLGIDRLLMIMTEAKTLARRDHLPGDAGARSRRARRGAAGSVGAAEDAAVERNHGAGEVGGALGAEEGDEVAVLGGLAEALGGDFAARALFGAGERAGGVGQPLGRKAPGGDRVDGDPVAGDLPGQGLQKADRRHPVRVGEVEEGDRLAGGGGADVDDPPPATLAHPGHDRVGEDLGGEDERAVGGLPGLAIVLERTAQRRPAGVEDEDLDRAEGVGDAPRQRREALEVVGVGGEAERSRPHFGRCFLQALGRAAGDRDPRPLASESDRDRPPDASAGRHHQRHPPLDTQLHRPSLKPRATLKTRCAGRVPGRRP